MNDSEKMLYLSSKLMMLSLDREHNKEEIEKVSDELAALQRQMQETAAHSAVSNVKDDGGFLKFTEKEILKMPKLFRTKFRLQGCVAHVRKRTTGRYKCSYEIRYNRGGYHISVSATTLAQAKERFIEKINNTVPDTEGITQIIPSNFDKFSIYWFENFHKRKVQPKTYKNNFNLYIRHIREKLKNYSLQAIPPAMTQELLESLPGNGKTADDVHSILNQIFDTAVTHGKLKINPLNLFVHTPHDKEPGIELTIVEELKLLNAYRGTVYGIIYPIMLYTGLRPNEYKTARIEGDFIVAINSKRKKRIIEYKKIPICSNLRNYIKDYINGSTQLPCRIEELLRKNFNKILPGHTLKDLRKTFNTRCVKCKVDTFARKLFMGHSIGKLDRTYTGNLDDYLLSEGKKLDQWYTLYPKNTPNFDD